MLFFFRSLRVEEEEEEEEEDFLLEGRGDLVRGLLESI